MKVTVFLYEDVERAQTDDVQLFTLRITAETGVSYQNKQRFSYILKVVTELMELKLKQVTFENEFPRQYKRNIFGFKLNPHKLEKRRKYLEIVS